MSIVNEYLSLTAKWKKEYGEKTLVLMQVGSFFEVYALKSKENTELQGSNIVEFASLNDMVISGKQVFVDKQQVMMAGFGLPQIEKYVKKMQENGYTVVIYKQDIQGKNTTRSLAEIVSPGTFFSTTDNDELHKPSNNILCIWIHSAVASKYFANKMKKMTVGIANIDIYTGKTTLFQFEIDASFHNPVTYDEIERYVSIYQPSECLIIANLEKPLLTDIIAYIGLTNCRKIHQVIMGKDDMKNTAVLSQMRTCAINAEKQIYQMEILKRFYPHLQPEFITTALMTYFIAIQAFCFLLDFVYQHSPNLVQRLKTPLFENHTDQLVLANHSLKQLNISDDSQHCGKLRSVSSLLNNCLTNMGKRQFMHSLHNPTAKSETLNASYEITAHLLKKEKTDWETMRLAINGIKDLEKLQRKLVLSKIAPKDFALLAHDLNTISRLFMSTEQDPVVAEYLTQTVFHGKKAAIASYCEEIINELARVFDLEKCKEMHTSDFSIDDEFALFINKGVSQDIDTQLKATVDSREKMDALRLFFSDLVKGVEKPTSGKVLTSASTKEQTQYIKIHETSKSVPVLLGTSKRIATLKTQIKKTASPVNISYISKYSGKEETFSLNLSLLNYETVGSNKKDLIITSEEIVKNAKEMQFAKDKLLHEMVLFYNNYLSIFLKYETYLDCIMQYSTALDILQNKCYIAYKYNYCKPEIEAQAKGQPNKSSLSFKGIRHPLIEHLQTNELYVTNDLTIGRNAMDGLLLYGTNAVGKTSFIKSVGIALIMAQAGLYVPCESFHFQPYKCIFTRILGNDNIFKGLSTFAVEMSELRTILTQADANSLVLGDELCSGTESDSALSIFTAGLETLHQKGSTFLFATHFHEIVKYEEIKALKNLQMMHMAVQYNIETGILMYDRRLRSGPGESMYGLEVCKSLKLPADFLQRAHAIRMRYQPESKNILSLATSQYNAKKIVGGLCELCKCETKNKADEIHHLQLQKKAKKQKNNFIQSFHKNHPANLVNICEECHHKIHLDEKNKEYKMVKTENGYELMAL
jgi:DNA mismatch repair protein MutS